jgi:hypothetical protein
MEWGEDRHDGLAVNLSEAARGGQGAFGRLGERSRLARV